jgi:trimeric autotransporter adhesin
MRRKIRAQLTTNRVMVLVIAVLFALAWAVPSIGASAGKVARVALARSNQAVHDSNVAVATSNTAKSTANSANATAGAANSTASSASNVANQALSTASGIREPAFAHINSGCTSPSGFLGCTFNRSSGVSSVSQTSTAGQYCITAAGRSPSTSSWVASVDAGGTSNVDETKALPSTGSGCGSGQFQVQTTRDTGSGASGASDVAFFVVIG